MWLWHNTQLIDGSEVRLNIDNRAFQYGDGFFETIIVKEGRLQHGEYHAERIQRSVAALKLTFKLTFTEIEKRIYFLLKKNDLSSARVKLIIWRKPGGLYSPKSSGSDFLITVDKLPASIKKHQHLEISTEIKISKGVAKNCKTLNALPYILAAIELKERNDADDLILLDSDNNISECIASNLFWIKNKKFFTPSLDTYCIAGVKRQFILDHLRARDRPATEVIVKVDDIMSADHVFKTNVTGIYKVKSIANKSFSTTFKLPFESL